MKMRTGAQVVRLASTKFTFCLRLPICDPTVQGQLYTLMNGRFTNRDCSGHGRCVWNQRKGNHCKCDVGYKPSTLQGRKLCCPLDGDSCAGDGDTEKETKPGSPAQTDSTVAKTAFKMGFQHGAQFVKEQQKPGSTLLGEANALETPWRRRRKTRRRKTIRKGDAKCSKLAENQCEENASCMLEDGECRAREESAEEKSGDAKLKKLKEDFLLDHT